MGRITSNISMSLDGFITDPLEPTEDPGSVLAILSREEFRLRRLLVGRLVQDTRGMAAGHVVIASDGTPIGCTRSGSGPPLLFVHGTGADRWSVRFIEPLLADRFTVYSVDRRGRGLSGDSDGEYRIEQEFDDIAAVIDSLEKPAVVFGHSFGATVALGAAPLASNFRSLILYEPAPGIPGDVDPTISSRLDALLAEGRREELLTAFMLHVAGVSLDDVEEIRTSPLWPSRVAAAHTIPREIRAEQSTIPDPAVYGRLTPPVMLLTGSESPGWAKQGVTLVGSLFPNSRRVVLEGEGHVGIMTAPERVAAEVIRFAGES